MDRGVDYEALMRLLSDKRMGPYLGQSRGSACEAIRCYEEQILWNAKLIIPLHILEVILRDRMDYIFSREIGPSWFMPHEGLVHGMQKKQVEKVLSNFSGTARDVCREEVISSLTFGFWTAFFSGKYEYQAGLWRRHLCNIFHDHAKRMDRKTVSKRLYKVRKLRNRVAHHEYVPTPQRNLNICLETIGWISPEARNWAVSLMENMP